MATYNVSPQLIEEQRKKLQEKTGGNSTKPKFVFNEKNYLNVRLNKGETKREMRVRILPVSADNPNIFFIVNTHSLKVNKKISESGFKSFMCLNDEHVNSDGRGCPLCEKSKQLFKEANAATNDAEKSALVKSALQYKAKETFIVRVIEREHEDEGVKFWRFNAHSDGQGIYDKLMGLYDVRNKESLKDTGEPYNIFDLVNGKDIVITLKPDMKGNKIRTAIEITDAGRETPLSKDEKEVEMWVNDPKTWSDMYSSKSADYLQLIADGEIPFYDKDAKKWVAEKEAQTTDNSEQTEAEARKELDVDVDESNAQNDDDLPF